MGHERGDEVGIRRPAEHRDDDVERGRVGDAQAVDLRRRDAATIELGVDRAPAAMDDAPAAAETTSDAAHAAICARCSRRLEQLAAKFEHQRAASQQGRPFVEATGDVEVLQRLARRALHQVVEARDDHEPPRSGVEPPADVAEVRPRDVLDLRQRVAGEPHERLVGVGRASNASAICSAVVPGATFT